MTQPPAPAMGPNQMPATWDLVAPGFAEEAAPHSVRYAARALELVPPEAAHRVLDVAAGSGPLSFLAASRAQRVDAVDFSPAFIDILRARAQREGVANVEAAVMDAAALAFDDETFDAAYCMFAFMFFPDRARAFRELRRVLKSGGRAVVCTWRPLERRTLMKLGMDVVAEVLPQVPAPTKGDLQEPDECIREMSDAGFADVRTELLDIAYHVESPEQYLRVLTRTGPPIAMMRQRVGETAWADIEQRLLEALRRRIPEGGTDLSAEAILTVGTR